ncbi:hypothetical protein PACTADRAFT_31003 [Pachysolen tannophilus NRRL Y-2460]|uniref:Uncharacterized protein n=1 Tax=Pachysolen tannophilus NRRL Y-2460 TaxID=669874 RepID=A0A1E4U0N1_PACTA|nr:hypothetical protein PACTADRAFT_31003 [Pachysolen tannophilus NRRL Y-2460]
MSQQKSLIKPALLLVLLGSVVINIIKERRESEDLDYRYKLKLNILEDIKKKLRNQEPIDLNDELRVINRLFENLGYGGTYFKGYVEKPNANDFQKTTDSEINQFFNIIAENDHPMDNKLLKETELIKDSMNDGERKNLEQVNVKKLESQSYKEPVDSQISHTTNYTESVSNTKLGKFL